MRSCTLALLLLGAAGTLAGTGPEDHVHDYVVKIAGGTAGVMKTTFALAEEDGQTVVRTSEHMHAKIERGSDVVDMQFDTLIVETLAGRALRSGYTQRMATQEIEMLYEYPAEVGGDIAVTSTQDGAKHHSVVTMTEPVYGKAHSMREIAANVGSSEPFTYSVVKPETGPLNVAVHCKVTAVEEVTGFSGLGGLTSTAPVQVTKLTTSIPALGLDSREWYSSVDVASDACDGAAALPSVALMYFSVPSAMGNLEALHSTEAHAAEVFRNPGKRPEVVQAAYAPLAHPVNELWAGEGSVVYEVAYKQATASPLELPDTGHQTVQPGEDGALRVQIDLARGSLLRDDERRDDYLQSSAMLDATDAGVRALADEARRTAGKEDARALALAAWQTTRGAIKHSNYATGFASATETARTRTGDCSENAVLLAAILRALNVPSRTVSGLVYLHDSRGANFAWHMWAQALLPFRDGLERWVDLDSTLGRPFTYGSGLLCVFVFDHITNLSHAVLATSRWRPRRWQMRTLTAGISAS